MAVRYVSEAEFDEVTREGLWIVDFYTDHCAKLHTTYIDTATQGYVVFGDVIVMIFAVVWGALQLRKGAIELQEWLMFSMFLPLVNGQLKTLINYWPQAKKVQGDTVRMSRIMEAPLEVTADAAEATASFQGGDIVFDAVSFAYGDNPVLRNVSFVAPEGKSMAIVGLYGSGKSTILNLVERLYEPSAGEIRVDKTPIDQFNIVDYRGHIAYVQQDAGIFSGSVREIVTYGVKRSVSDQEINDVLRLTGMYNYVSSLPDGLDSEIALWGSSLSGGQRQRLVIARELLKKSDILLLDEPTAALDAVSARAVQDTIFRLFRGKTIIIVTHDLSLISQVDQIVVLNDGTIEASGTHAELMESCELYRELVAEQSYREVYAG
jgi:ATP-binding cassette subfamily B protein AbcA/BmrA